MVNFIRNIGEIQCDLNIIVLDSLSLLAFPVVFRVFSRSSFMARILRGHRKLGIFTAENGRKSPSYVSFRLA